MLKRVAALIMVLAFASQVLAGAFACKGDHSSPAEMACCALAKSGNASPAAVICCETVCGEPTNGNPGTHSETKVRPHVPAFVPAVFAVPALIQLPVVPVTTRSCDAALLYRDPPALYLHNSAFLI